MAETNLTLLALLLIIVVFLCIISFFFFIDYKKTIKEANCDLNNLYRLVSTTLGDLKKVQIFIEPTERNRHLLSKEAVREYLQVSRLSTKTILINNKMYYQLLLRDHYEIIAQKAEEIIYDLEQFGIHDIKTSVHPFTEQK